MAIEIKEYVGKGNIIDVKEEKKLSKKKTAQKKSGKSRKATKGKE